MTKTRDQLEQEVRECYAQYTAKKKELAGFKIEALQEYYGLKISCDTCRYSCVVNVADFHTYCLKGECYLCKHLCEHYAPQNELSKILHERYPYEPSIVEALEALFDVYDILSQEQLHDKVIRVLDIVKEAEDE
jgi:outer membrane protein assembly factor BamD (BamD/ComL family)